MKSKSGFTLLEALIVIAVTSVLLISALSLIAGRQGRTQFSTGVREIQGLMNDVMNDVGNGILPEIPGMTCSTGFISNTPPDLSYSGAATDTIGRNQECVLAGKIVQLGTDTDPTQFVTYSIVGRRLTASNETVDDFSELAPLTIHPINAGGATEINSKSTSTLPWSIKVVQNDGSNSAVAFAIMYRQFTGADLVGGQITSGNSAIGIVPIFSGAADGTINATEAQIVGAPSTLTIGDFLSSGDRLEICLESPSSNQYALLTLSVSGIGLTAETIIIDNQSTLNTRTCA